MSIIENILRVLNSAANSDPEAIYNLLEHRVVCNSTLANHPTVQVRTEHGKDLVGALGLINAIVEELCINHGEGAKRVAVILDPNNKKATRFIEYVDPTLFYKNGS